MKNKTFYCTLLILIAFVFASCAGSRQGYGNHRKGYGCPATVSIPAPSVEISKV